MSIALVFFSVPLKMLVADILSVATGVGGCRWPISARAVFMDVAFCQFSNNPSNYASMTDAMTFLIMIYSTYTGPFSGGISCISVLYFDLSTKYAPALICSSGYKI